MTPEQRIAQIEQRITAIEKAHNDCWKTAADINRIFGEYLIALTQVLCEAGSLDEKTGLALTQVLNNRLAGLRLERSWEKPTEAGSDAS